ncbi:MAG: metallophosphoesterase [Clostridia bacterium]|nr:metallophosphoesterase [Clostridia bacterium]
MKRERRFFLARKGLLLCALLLCFPAGARAYSALTVPNGVYTIAWISDTQHYSESYPDHYFVMTEFLTNARARLNLRYIVHTGDLVHNDNRQKEWEVADGAQRIIDHIPNGVCAGNHDLDDGVPSEYYQQYFGQARYEHKPWYGGSYQNNRGHYDLIDAGNTRYIFVYMSYNPDETAIKWLNSVFKQYSDRIGVLCTHSYFKTNMTRSNDGQVLYNKVVKTNPNIYMVLCGHRYNQGYKAVWLEDDGDGEPDRLVYEMINNYQAIGEEGGDGYLRLLQMDEQAGIMRVYTYSPVKLDYNYFDTPESQREKYRAEPEDEEYELPLPWIASKQAAATKR